VIFTNQLRQKIGVMFGNPETTTGGMALKFYASIRLDVRRVQSIKLGDEVIGNRTKVRVVKNKVAAPFRSTEFDIMYNEGISKSGDVLDMATEMEIISKRLVLQLRRCAWVRVIENARSTSSGRRSWRLKSRRLCARWQLRATFLFRWTADLRQEKKRKKCKHYRIYRNPV
jgi:hypothetical protein